MAVNPRAYSTNYADHVGLLHKYSRKFYPHVLHLRLPMEYEDLFGEMLVAFTKAAQGYDPSRGITFTAYLGQCCTNQFYSKVLGVYSIKEVKVTEDGTEAVGYRPRCIPTESLEELSESIGGEEFNAGGVQAFLDRHIDDQCPSPEDILIQREEFRSNLKRLSNDTRHYLLMLLGKGEKPSAGYTRDQSRQIKQELKEVYGIAPNIVR